MRVYFDCEFTGLQQRTELISIGLISEGGRTFYAEFNDYNDRMLDEWLHNNVIVNLRFNAEHASNPVVDMEHHAMKGSTGQVAQTLRAWLEQWDRVEMWSDCLAYDWVLFCNLFGGAMNLPPNVFYIPVDISTIMLIKGVDPDVNREEFAGLLDVKALKHNALWDAKVIRACAQKLDSLRMEWKPTSKGRCAVCGEDVFHAFPWFTKNPSDADAKPLHEECRDKWEG